MVEWHHQLNQYEFEQTLGDGEGQVSLTGCSPCVPKELDTTDRLNKLLYSVMKKRFEIFLFIYLLFG